MRRIDADALKRKWQAVLDCKTTEKETVAYRTFELFIERLDEEPTIEAEPVKHGRWVDAYGDTVGMVNGIPWSDCWCGKCGFGGHVGRAKYLGNTLHKESPAERKAREAAKKARAANMEAIRALVRNDPNYARLTR